MAKELIRKHRLSIRQRLELEKVEREELARHQVQMEAGRLLKKVCDRFLHLQLKTTDGGSTPFWFSFIQFYINFS